MLRLAIVLKQDRVPVLIDDVLRLVVDDRFDHGDRRRIQRTVDAADFADHRFDFWNRVDRHVLRLQNVVGLADRRVRHCRRHIEVRPLIQRRHELFSQAGEFMRRGCIQDIAARPAFGNPDLVQAIRHKPKHAVESQPHARADQHNHSRYREKRDLVRQAPAQNRLVESLKRMDAEQNGSEDKQREQEIR